MKLRGGYNIQVAGRASGHVEVLAEPDTLYLPLRSRRFSFSELCVKQGQRVDMGRPVARDPDNYLVPLLAPRGGTVRLDVAQGHVVLEDLDAIEEGSYDPLKDAPHVPKDLAQGSSGMKRYRLLELGAWQCMYDAHTGALPDPFGSPGALIVSTVHLEPFVARGDVQLHKRLSRFTRGLEHLQALLEYQPIYLVLPDVHYDFADKVRQAIRGYAWAKLITVPPRYPLDDFRVLARSLGLKASVPPDAPVWAMRTEGVLAVDRALTLSKPCTVKLISLAGPAVRSPMHLKAMPGYPIDAILRGRLGDAEARVIDGGLLTGTEIGAETRGLQTECSGLTVLDEHSDREFLGFMRLGFDRRSYSRCFASVLRGRFGEQLTTAVRGEGRPCVSCGFCEEVCPAGIMPNLIHKYIYADELEQIERAGVNLCVACGLCSYVCPSKIELMSEILDSQETVRRELHGGDERDKSFVPAPASAPPQDRPQEVQS